MSGTTGWPLNLNTFDGADDIVDALTTHFNQNMNNINKANVTAKMWDNNVYYNQWDIVQNKFEWVTMICIQGHTSSNANSKQMWGDQDGSKWIYINNFPKLNAFIQNMYIPSGSIFMDGNAIKIQDNGVARATMDRTDSHFLSSRVESWTPNTKYNVGDLVYIKSLHGSSAAEVAKGEIEGGILRAKKAHTSTTVFPSSTDDIWELTNVDTAYYIYRDDVAFPYQIKVSAKRKGNMVMFDIANNNHGSIPDTGHGWNAIGDSMDPLFLPKDRVLIHGYPGPAFSPAITFQLDPSGFTRFGTAGYMSGDYYIHSFGSPTFAALNGPYWEAGTPAT